MRTSWVPLPVEVAQNSTVEASRQCPSSVTVPQPTAAQLTRHVPVAWEAAIADNALRQMDDGMLKPSKLPPERQAALRARFDALAR